MQLFIVDSFTNKPFGGNPAGVCVFDAPADMGPARSGVLQRIAAELNLSETAFVAPTGPNRYNLRWFTPLAEVDLCGHATLAPAHLLFETGQAITGEPIWFDTLSGPLSAVRDDDSAGFITLDFPAEAPLPADAQPQVPGSLLPALGLEAGQVVTVVANRHEWLVHVSSETDLMAVAPNMAVLGMLPVRGVLVTAPSQADEGKVDFVSRCFYPKLGVPEDPVTGSAHCFLGPYWGQRLGKTRLKGWQASARGGLVAMGLDTPGRVMLSGQACTVFELTARTPVLQAAAGV
ncbi:MAG: PhzF family phenazine biosynthesis protein [Cyanobacteria bacterium HKST-UBA04]|nr:PhzF family phenazine biosynthesis protein [Cyanobacteria bacterium HKST-UBA04]